MPWVLLDDEFNDHPKWASASCDSIAMWVAALAWCNRNERWDGSIPTIRLAGLVNAKNPKRTIADLEQRQAIHRDGDQHLIHDFAQWQRVDKKKAVSEARRVNGKKGAASRWGHGKPDGKPDGNSHSKPDGLPPTTYNREYISDNSTPENTPPPGDNSRRDDILDAYATAELDRSKAKGIPVSDDDRYKRSIRQRASMNPDLDRWLTMFPTAPATAIAAWLTGDKHSMSYYPRADDADEHATVHPIHRLPGAS